MAADAASRGSRYHSLDLWRGVACLMVVLHHAGFAVILDRFTTPRSVTAPQAAVISVLAVLNLGVSIFFVISGYCIAASVRTARDRGVGALVFLGRRVRRIYPPYWASFFALVAFAAGLDAVGLSRLHYGPGRHALQLDSPGVLGPAHWLGNLTLTESWRDHVWGPHGPKIYTRVAWSLCFEEQFYFVCFLCLLLARGRLRWALAGVTVLCLMYRSFLADIGQLDRLRGTFPLLWHEFAAGVAVYWRLNVAATARQRLAVDVALGALAVLGLLGYFGGSPVWGSSAVVGLFGLALVGLRRWDDVLHTTAWLAPLRACGRWSYSIYLIHLPVCTFGNLLLYEQGLTGFWARTLVMIPLVSVVAVGVGWLFYHAVERHFLNAPLPRPAAAPAPVSAAAPAPPLKTAPELRLDY